jgi:copper chaperone NosL
LKNIAFLLLFLVALSACKRSEEWPPAPVKIQLGETFCAQCKMIVSDERYGAQLFERGKPVEVFDDYGCFLMRRGANDSNQRVAYVRSFEDTKWVREEQALFVVSKNISSPMGYGIAAFPEKDAAARFAQTMDDSKIYSLLELIPAAEKIVRAGFPKKE